MENITNVIYRGFVDEEELDIQRVLNEKKLELSEGN